MSTYENFWKSKSVDDFKKLGNSLFKTKQRLSYDIQKIIPHVRNTKIIADLACGNGEHIKILNDIFNFDKIYISDINTSVAFNTVINLPLNAEQCISCDLNFTKPPETDLADTILMLGVIQYIQDNNRLKQLLNEFKMKTVIIKASCYEDQTIHIDKYSEDIGEDYEATYRDKNWIINEMKKVFKTVKHEMLYPKDLDSKYGSKQYLFIGKP